MTPRGRRRLMVPLLASTLLPLAACGGDDEGGVAPRAATPTTDAAQQEAVDPFLGKVVTISGRVVEVIGTSAFTVGGESWSGEPVQVVDAADATVSDGDAVEVTGLVRVFDRSFLEEEYQVDLADPGLTGWAGDHVLVTNVVEPAGPG